MIPVTLVDMFKAAVEPTIDVTVTPGQYQLTAMLIVFVISMVSFALQELTTNSGFWAVGQSFLAIAIELGFVNAHTLAKDHFGCLENKTAAILSVLLIVNIYTCVALIYYFASRPRSGSLIINGDNMTRLGIQVERDTEGRSTNEDLTINAKIVESHQKEEGKIDIVNDHCLQKKEEKKKEVVPRPTGAGCTKQQEVMERPKLPPSTSLKSLQSSIGWFLYDQGIKWRILERRRSHHCTLPKPYPR